MTLSRFTLARLILAAVLCLAASPAVARRSADAETSARCVSEPLVRCLLEASGNARLEVDRGARQYHTLVELLRSSESPATGEHQQARTIHVFIHERVVRQGYHPSASNLARLLNDGTYNCATSSAIFIALAAEIGLKVNAVALPGHVWCRVATGDGTFDVETTCRDWFELADRDETARAAAGRVLDQQSLVALFQYNRGVGLFREGRYLSAAEANLMALVLDPRCEPALENLLGAFNQRAVELAAAGRHAEALSLLERAMAAAPSFEPFQVNRRILSGDE